MIPADDLVMRDVCNSDMGASQAIFAHHVCHGLASLEGSLRDSVEMRTRRATMQDSDFS